MDMLDLFIREARKNMAGGYYDVEKAARSRRFSLVEPLLANRFSIIAEIKRASPGGEYSLGVLDARKAAKNLEAAGADALSVVVEPKIFKGDIRSIALAKETGLPVLFKDFVVDEKQILAASMLGADAILFVMKVASRIGADIEGWVRRAHEMGLETVLECFDRDELTQAKNTNADIIGINNRDLRDLKIDLRRTTGASEEIARMGRPVISESGVMSREDIELLVETGVKGALVGTALWKSGDPAKKLAELKARPS